MQRAARQRQREAAVVVAEGADLAGGGTQGPLRGAGVTQLGSHRATQMGWPEGPVSPTWGHPGGSNSPAGLGTASYWSYWGLNGEGMVPPLGDLGGGASHRGLVPTIRGWCQPLGAGATPLGMARGWCPPLVPRTWPIWDAWGLVSPLGMPPLGTGGDSHLVAVGAGATGLAGGGAAGWVPLQVGAGGTGLAGTGGVVQGMPRGAGGAGPPWLGGAASAEGGHPAQHVGDVDGVELGHVAGVPPALAPGAAVSIPRRDTAVPVPVPSSPPRGRACAGTPR